MIKYLSENITAFFIYKEIINHEEKDIFVYGLHLIISSIIGIAIILTIGLSINRMIDTLVFLFVFISVRTYSGGYHASTYTKCNLTLISIYLIIIIATNIVPIKYLNALSHCTVITTILIVLKYAPIENKNKKLTILQKKTNKRISLFLIYLDYSIALIFFRIGMQFSHTIILTLILISILILVKSKEVIT